MLRVDAQLFGAGDAIALTKSDSTTYVPPFNALYIGGAGDVAVRTYPGGTTVTFSGAAAGSIIPIQCDRLMSANTTATSVLGLRY